MNRCFACQACSWHCLQHKVPVSAPNLSDSFQLLIGAVSQIRMHYINTQYMCIYIYTHVQTYKHIYIYMYICIYIYICMYMHIMHIFTGPQTTSSQLPLGPSSAELRRNGASVRYFDCLLRPALPVAIQAGCQCLKSKSHSLMEGTWLNNPFLVGTGESKHMPFF